jgi:hypothetical protein
VEEVAIFLRAKGVSCPKKFAEKIMSLLWRLGLGCNGFHNTYFAVTVDCCIRVCFVIHSVDVTPVQDLRDTR